MAHARSSWYRYYAGYSAEFVRGVLDHLQLPAGSTVLDPWNGSGTTTAAASEAGHNVLGFDANPALVIVARGRHVDQGTAPSLSALTNDMLRHAKDMVVTAIDLEPEPLEAWFDVSTACRLRALEQAIQLTLVDDGGPLPVRVRGLSGISTLAAFFYVALFEVTRSFVTSFRTTNPTWIKSATSAARVGGTWDELDVVFREAVARLSRAAGPLHSDLSGTLEVASSLRLPTEGATVEATVTSPPYCTRIDYIVATLPELAVLGYGQPQAIRELRHGMVGTPTIWTKATAHDQAWGEGVAGFLEKVGAHPSRASASYYWKYFHQYFQSMWLSMAEIRRVSKPGAPLVMVVQDSYYKEVHVDLPAMLQQMAINMGWTLVERVDYLTPVTKAAINPGSRKYRTTFSAVESVLVWSA